jgi:hypothetical protein
MMPVNLIIVLIGIGIVLWLINTCVPMQAAVKRIMNAAVVIGAALWVLAAFGGIRLWHGGTWY